MHKHTHVFQTRLSRWGCEAKAGVTKRPTQVWVDSSALAIRKWQAPGDLCEFPHIGHLYLHRAPVASFDKAKVIADFFSGSDQLWVEHLKDLVDAMAWSWQRCRRRILAEGVNLQILTLFWVWRNDNREYLQPVVSSGNGSDYTPPETLASNKYFWLFLLFTMPLAVYAYDSALFRLHGAIWRVGDVQDG